MSSCSAQVRMLRCCPAGLTLTEAQNINRSLLELGNVISALMQNASHVPYRRAPDPVALTWKPCKPGCCTRPDASLPVEEMLLHSAISALPSDTLKLCRIVQGRLV